MAIEDQTIIIGEGNTRPIWTLTLYTRNSAGVKTVADLSAVGTVAKITMLPLNSSTAKINAATMSIVSPGTQGVVQYTPTTANTDTPGEYRAKIHVTYASNVIETFPNKGFFRIIVTEKD
jgi:hypothetical protein